jgi:hypothetical protein
MVLCEKDLILPPKRYSPLFFSALPQRPLKVVLRNKGHEPMYEDRPLVTETIREDLLRRGVQPYQRVSA